MTPSISVRSYTTDQYYLDKIFYSNFYQILPVAKSNRDSSLPVGAVVDVGAHCGYFALTAIAAGYTKCYCFEPLEANYRALLRNTEVFPELISCFQMGVKATAGFIGLEPKTPDQRQFIDYGSLQEAPYNGIAISPAQITELVTERISILKINTGESFDFTSAELLNKVDNICFELPYSASEAIIIKDKLQTLGFTNSLLIELKENDQNFGFLGFFSKDKLENTFDIEHLKSKNYET
jgi:FkbM family methyltransferase